MKYSLNKIKVDVASYRHYWRGIPKIGKTSLFRDLILEAYGDPKYGFLISPGNETGFKAIDNLIAHETPTWEAFVETVDDLVENRKDNEFKMIALDTVDELVSIASDRVLKVHLQRKGTKCNTLNESLGGFGNGAKMVVEIINDQIKRLESMGYGLVFISHTKIKDVKEKDLESPYQQLVGNLESRFDKIFLDKADVVATLYLSKEVESNKLVGTKRWIYFRGDGFIEAGSRFANMPERIEMSAKNYLLAFNQAVQSSFSAPNVTATDIEQIRKTELAETEKKATEYISSVKESPLESDGEVRDAEHYRKLIESKSKELDEETKNQKMMELKEKGINIREYKKMEDINTLRTILKVVSSL